MPLQAAAADGASRDPAPVLHTGVRAWLGATFDVGGAAPLGENSLVVDVAGRCWRAEVGGGTRTDELAAIWAINVVAGIAVRVLAKDGTTAAAERFKALVT